MRVAVIALTVLLTACASTGPAVGVTGVSDRLFCGLERNGTSIPEADIVQFIDEVVAPRFPDGFTVWRAEGRWRGGTGDDGREMTLVIEVIHPYGWRYDDKVKEIANEYRRRFQQQAVMRVTTPAVMELSQ